MIEGITPLHLVLVLAIALIVIGPGKLPSVGKALGESIREFRKATTDVKGAIESIDRLTGPEWYAVFKELHAGLIFDVSGNRKDAGKRLERVYKLDANALKDAAKA